MRISALDRFENCFRGDHAGLHRRVRSLDLGNVHEAGCAADQTTAGKRQLGDALKATLVQRPSTVTEVKAKFKMLLSILNLIVY